MAEIVLSAIVPYEIDTPYQQTIRYITMTSCNLSDNSIERLMGILMD